MKRLALYILLLSALVFNLAMSAGENLASLISSPVIFNNIDLRTWPTAFSESDAFDIFSSMSESDADTNQIIVKSKQKLSQHGILDIHSILSFCPDDQSLGEAYFSQQVHIIGNRIVLPGATAANWSADSIDKANKSFLLKTVKTPFIEFLLGADRPNICLKKADNLLFSYNPMMHELFHFLAKDIFKELEDGITAKAAPNFLDSMVSQVGGEFDAYKAGFSAEIKFINKNKIPAQRDIYRFFDKTSGQLTNANGLKDYILKLYAPYYNDPTTISAHKQDRLNLIQWQIQVLDVNVRPLVFAGDDKNLQAQFSAELNRLQSQHALLSK